MPEEIAIMFMFMFTGGGLIGGYLWGKARTTQKFMDRFGDMMLREEGRRSAQAVPPPPEPSVQAVAGRDLARVTAALDSIVQRFDQVEQRLDFTEKLVERGQRREP